MGQHTEGTFEVTAWNEEPSPGAEEAAKVTVARYAQRWSGGLDGQVFSDIVMTYEEGAGASYVGFERVIGTLGGQTGSFVLQTTGNFDGRHLRSTTIVVPGAGRDSLAGLRGTGTISAPLGQTGTWTLDYELD